MPIDGTIATLLPPAAAAAVAAAAAAAWPSSQTRLPLYCGRPGHGQQKCSQLRPRQISTLTSETTAPQRLESAARSLPVRSAAMPSTYDEQWPCMSHAPVGRQRSHALTGTRAAFAATWLIRSGGGFDAALCLAEPLPEAQETAAIAAAVCKAGGRRRERRRRLQAGLRVSSLLPQR